MPFDALCDVLTSRMARRIWTAGYPAVLSLTPLYLYMRAVLPAVLCEMRRGHRRGADRFASVSGKPATVAVQAILGDLLLAHCLENRNGSLGQTEPGLAQEDQRHLYAWNPLDDRAFLVEAALRDGVQKLIIAPVAPQ